MKKKYKTLKDANNKTGVSKQKWEYFDIMNDMLCTKPEIAPLSIASSSRGFQINTTSHTSTRINNVEGNEENLVESNNVQQSRITRKRKRQTPAWIENIIEQRQQHHENNYAQRERFLALLEKYINK